MADIFMSYAREDQARIRDLVSALEGQGWSVFWDRRIPAGKTWQSYIGQALGDAKCMIVAWSRDSIISDWVIEEANEAKKRGLLMPVLLDPVEPPLGFRGIQAADLTGWKPGSSSTQFDQLAQDIVGLIGGVPRGLAPEGELNARTQPMAVPKPMASEPSQHEPVLSMPEPHNAGAQEPKAIESGFADRGEKRRKLLKGALIVTTLAVAVVVVLWLSRGPRSSDIRRDSSPSEEAKKGAVRGGSVSEAKTDAKSDLRTGLRVLQDVVIDLKTRLMWTRGDFKTITGRYAKDWNETMLWAKEMRDKNYAGFSDWRVASILEYRTIIQPSWRDVFLSDMEDYYWARDEIDEYVASYIDFNSGAVASVDKTPSANSRRAILKYSSRLVRPPR